tara:strand:+ start:661 stop:1008 length:348 start_codon:yes stop_codon:yes gene_type:complete
MNEAKGMIVRKSPSSGAGSHWQGELKVHTTYNALVEVLGEPQYADNDGKVHVEWNIESCDGSPGVATVYDWREEVDPRLYPDTNFRFHIGCVDFITGCKLQGDLVTELTRLKFGR